MRAAVMRNRALVVADVPDARARPGRGARQDARLRDLRLRPARAEARRQVRRDLAAGRQPARHGPRPRRRHGPRVLRRGRRARPGTTRALKAGGRVCSRPVLMRARPGRRASATRTTIPGGYGEYMRLSEALLLRCRTGCRPSTPALTEPMAVGVHAVAKARLEPDDAPLVIGCGPVGLAVIAALRLRGVAPIVAADFSPARRELARGGRRRRRRRSRPGHAWHELARGGDLARHEPGAGAAAMDPRAAACVRPWSSSASACRACSTSSWPPRRAARASSWSACAWRPDTIQPMLGINKELNLQFVLGYTPEEFAATLRHIAEGAIPTTPLITGHVGLRASPRPSRISARPSATPKSSSAPRSLDHSKRARLLSSLQPFRIAPVQRGGWRRGAAARPAEWAPSSARSPEGCDSRRVGWRSRSRRRLPRRQDPPASRSERS